MNDNAIHHKPDDEPKPFLMPSLRQIGGIVGVSWRTRDEEYIQNARQHYTEQINLQRMSGLGVKIE